jgi:senataxin
MALLRTMPWHKNPLFKPYQFLNIADGHEEKASSGHSLLNRAEIRAAIQLYNRLVTEFATFDFESKIGIIAMYDAQKQELIRQFSKKFGDAIVKKVAFGTIDGFQGQEKDIIIVSTVRGGPGVSSIGHVSDIRRMNVAITRARSSLFILGHAATLERSDGQWKAIVQDARERQMLLTVSFIVDFTLWSSSVAHSVI